MYTHYVLSSDEFELEFSGSSEPELWRVRAESSRAGALQFSSWNRADNTYNMYVKKKEIFNLFFPHAKS